MTPDPPPASSPAPESVPVAFRADEVHVELSAGRLQAVGHVRIEQPPFFLESEDLELRRVPLGVDIIGQGRVTFCPCLGGPLALRFTGATVAPPHDVFVRDPVLEVFGAPIAWAPAFWLRSPARPGLLPPDLQLRAADGLYLGGGVHVPWIAGDTQHGLDVHAGWYTAGGEAIRTTLASPSLRADVTWDRFQGQDGISVAARGASDGGRDAPGTGAVASASAAGAVASASATGAVTSAFAVDALRGGRAVRAATDAEQAARPFDRGEAFVALRASGITLATGAVSTAVRGGDLETWGVGGPILTGRMEGALGRSGAFDATVEGGQLSGAGTGAALSFARGEAGSEETVRAGALVQTLAARVAGDVADDGQRSRAEGLAQLRARAALPLGRTFGSGASDGWLHRTEPYAALGALSTSPHDPSWIPLARGAAAPEGRAWVAAFGWNNALGRGFAAEGMQVDLGGGAVGSESGVNAVLRARGAAETEALAADANVARVLSRPGRGGAARVSVRLGAPSGLHVGARVFERDGSDPIASRVLVDPLQEPSNGFADAPGWSASARVSLPAGPRITVRGGADVDLDARALVAAAAVVDIHDPCGCIALRIHGAHRIGRSGTDVWVAVDWPLDAR